MNFEPNAIELEKLREAMKEGQALLEAHAAKSERWHVVPADGRPFRFCVAKNFGGIVYTLKDGFTGPQLFRNDNDAQRIANKLNGSAS